MTAGNTATARRKRTTKAAANSALEVAKRARAQSDGGPVQLATGYWVKVRPVSYSLITEAQRGIVDPPIPTYFNDEKGREEENPHDPAYTAALEKAESERILVGLDVMMMMGVDLVDEEGNPAPVPDPDTWLGKLKFLHRRGLINLDNYDLDDPDDMEFLFKHFILVSASDIAIIGNATGIPPEVIEQAQASFPDNEG